MSEPKVYIVKVVGDGVAHHQAVADPEDLVVLDLILSKVRKDAGVAVEGFIAQAGEGAARNEPVPPSSANETPAARGAHSDEHAPKGIEQSPAPVSQRVLTDQEIGQLPPEVFTYAAENVDFLNSIKHADFAKGAIMCAHYLRSKGYFGVSQPQQELIRAGDAMREWMVPASRRTAAKRSLKQPGASSSKRSPKPSKR